MVPAVVRLVADRLHRAVDVVHGAAAVFVVLDAFRVAPRRHDRGRPLLLYGRTGIPDSGAPCNRREQCLAVALWIPSRGRITLPLPGPKATESLMGAYHGYVSAVVHRFWDYAEREFGDRPELFERSERSAKRPPVFVAGAAEHNLLYPPCAEPKVHQAIVASLPPSVRHPKFVSMRSSQALAQSVFGSLVALSKAGVLAGLTTDDGLPTVRSGVAVRMEYLVEHLACIIHEGPDSTAKGRDRRRNGSRTSSPASGAGVEQPTGGA